MPICAIVRSNQASRDKQQEMTITTGTEMTGSEFLTGRSHAGYQRALRHSRRVRILRFLFPVLSALVIAGFAGVSWLRTMLPDEVAIESTAIEDGKIVMRNPVMTGQNSDGRAYALRAARAVQDLATPDLIVLEEISAEMPVSEGVTGTLQASSGTYDRAGEKMQFTEPLEVQTSSGMVAILQSAEFDIAGGNLVSSDPVSIRTAQSTLVAQSMRMQDKGRTIIFETDIRMTITPSAVRPAGRTDNKVAD